MYQAKYESKTKIKNEKLKNQNFEIKNFSGLLYGNVTGKLKLNQDNKVEILIKIEDEVIEELFGPIKDINNDIERIYDWFYDIASNLVYYVNNELIDNGFISDDGEFLDFKLVGVQYNDDDSGKITIKV